MIQLKAVAKPKELTNDIVKQLTEDYKDKGDSVWQKDYIKDALLKMSFGKCCFCECKVDEESKYLEVEYFYPKDLTLYPDEVLSWENLLPICKRCNTTKGNHDTKKEPIIHPVKDDPKQHLKLIAYRLYGKTDIGKRTIIDVLNLNDKRRLVKKRIKISESVLELLVNLLELTTDYHGGIQTSTRRKNRIISSLENIMVEGTKKYEYSATAATTILQDPNYIEIKKLFLDCNLWSDDFKQLETQVNYCALHPEKN